jgi:hypothetical protein
MPAVGLSEPVVEEVERDRDRYREEREHPLAVMAVPASVGVPEDQRCQIGCDQHGDQEAGGVRLD